MKTKADAEARLSRCALRTTVTVEDVEGGSRRAFRFSNPDGPGTTTVEIDADPSDRQLEDLAANIPVLGRDRAAALAIFREAQAGSAAETAPRTLFAVPDTQEEPDVATPKGLSLGVRVAIGVAVAAAAAAGIAQQIGVLP